jgi:ATP:ADP antiporter, AAA family
MAIQRAIERFFGTTIKPQERRIVVLLTLDLFVLLTVYYMLKIVREPLILLDGGVVSRNAARGTQAAILMVLVPLYDVLANRMRPRRLVTAVFGFFLVSLLSFSLLIWVHVPSGFAFFVWLGIFSIMAVAQFWSLANDLFSEEEGKRLFPVIAAGATVGAVVGSQIVVRANAKLGPTGLILVASGLLAACIWLTQAVRHAAELHGPVTAREPESRFGKSHGGFRQVLGNRYLLLIGLSILVLNLINTTGDQVMALLVQKHAAELVGREARAAFMLSFYGNFQTWVSVLTAVIQVFVVSRVLRFTGVRGAVLALPLLAFTGYALLAAVPALLISRGLKILEDSTEYSLQNTVQQVLFLPTSRNAKYKGKAATDTFFVRFGDMGSWALVSVALHAGWGPRVLSLMNVGAALVWIGIAVLLARRYQKLAVRAGVLPASALAPESAPSKLGPSPVATRKI